MIRIEPSRASQAHELIGLLDELQTQLYPPSNHYLDNVETLEQSHVFFVRALDDENLAVGCGAVKRLGDYGEIKRMFVQEQARRQGIAKRIMTALEAHLIEQGIRLARLETGIHQPDAIALYRSLGYVERGPFGHYPEDEFSVFMEKAL
ncbi:GNAT family N-acetyltransferase [Phytohalomonas tamaricis]|uniref:GNAT family N-acetyltransferase n=1 Tax=Phytohalomonas tamaricis TaxID=2081032 RepID=UPI0021D46DA3|nr:GNAT family N-acetyltransferase [Phytohalomonas tamaricis]